MKPIKKAPTSRNKIAPKPAANKKPQATVPCPDEHQPDVKADELYGDTRIPEHHRKK